MSHLWSSILNKSITRRMHTQSRRFVNRITRASRFQFSASLLLTQDPMMAYMLLQRWRAPVSVELHPYGKVAVAGGELQGWWAIDGAANNLSVCFDDDSQAQSLLFEAVQGTAVMASKGKKVFNLDTVTRPQEILPDAPPAPIEPPKKYAFVLLVPGAEPIDLLLGYNLQR